MLRLRLFRFISMFQQTSATKYDLSKRMKHEEFPVGQDVANLFSKVGHELLFLGELSHLLLPFDVS